MTPIETVQALNEATVHLRAINALFEALLSRSPQAVQAESALENCRLYAARYRKLEWAQTILRFCAEDGGATGSPLREAVQEPASVPTDEDILAAVRGETYVARDADEERLVVTAARAALSAFGSLTVKD